MSDQEPRARWLPFLTIEVATTLSGVGNGVTTVALPWLVLERTGSATAAGVLAAITAVPTMISAFLSGTIIDRVGRRRVSIGSDVLSLISVSLIPLLDVRVGLTYPMIVVLAVLGAVFDPAGMGAREAMLPEAAKAAGLPLAKANGIHEAVWGGAYVIGPALGGVLIALVGPAATFWATAVMFVLSILVVWAVPLPGGGPPQTRDDETFLRATAAGIRFVWRDRLLRALCLVMMTIVGLWLPVEGVILPVHFEATDNPGGLGIVMMALSLGGIAGALAYGFLVGRLGQRLVFLGGLVASTIFVIAAATLPSVAWLAVWCALAGFAFGPYGPVISVAMQTRTPSGLRGRVVGLLTAVEYAAGPLGFLLAGPLVDRFGVEPAFLVLAGLLLLICVAAFLMPALRELDTLPTEVPDDEALLEDVQPPHPLT